MNLLSGGKNIEIIALFTNLKKGDKKNGKENLLFYYIIAGSSVFILLRYS
jgi:hypothetical protein